MTAILDFLEGRGPDGAGRSVAQVLAFGLGALESHHDFIQWLFPLASPSRAIAGAPVLTPADIEEIKASIAAQANLSAGKARMEWFYDWTDHWLKPSDHNHLRITRITKSLRLLVGDAEANQFRARILARAHRLGAEISDPTRRYWMEA